MPSITTSAAALHLLLLLLLLSFSLRPLSSTSTPQPRRILHQPLLPEDPSSPPPAPSPPKYPFTTSAPDNSPFFQSYPSPPPPPAPASFASFPANISSITVPGPTKPNSSSSKLIIAAVAAVVAAIAVVSLAVFLHLRHRTTSRRSSSFSQSKPPNSDTSSVVSFNQAPNTHHIPKLLRPSQSSSEFLYLGTLVNSHAPASASAAAAAGSGGATRTNYSVAANSRKLDSPELRPLPPLNTRQQSSGNNAEVISSKDDESEEFYSPKGSINGRESSIGAGSASRRAFAAVVTENFNGSTSNSSSTYSSSIPGSGSPVRSASFSPINSVPKSPDLIEIQTVAPLPPLAASPPEARSSTPQVSASPSPSSSSSLERNSRRSEEISPSNSGVLDQSLESPAAINSLVLHNTIAYPPPPETRGLELPTCQSPLSSPTSSSPESSPRYSSVSDRSAESPVRSYIAVEIEMHNANDIPTSPELLEYATPLALSSSPKNSNLSDQNLESPVRDSSNLGHTIPSPTEIRGLAVLESASPVPLSSLSPERCPTESAESSPRNSNVSDQFMESPVRSNSPVHNNPAVTPPPEIQGFVLPDSSPAALPNSDVWDWNVESPVRSSSPAHQGAAEIPTASEIQPESALSPERCLMRSEESSPTNSDSDHTESPVISSISDQHNSAAIPTATEIEALVSPDIGSPLAMGSYSPRSYSSSEESSPRSSSISDQNDESPVGIISPTEHNSDGIPMSPELEALVFPESTSTLAFTSSSPRNSNVSDEHKESPASQVPSPPDSPAPDNYSGENVDTSPRFSNASDHDVESPVMQNLVLSSPPVCIIPPPPPPPPPPAPTQRLSPRTPTPPGKNRLEPPALVNPLRPISFESSTLISPMQLPPEDPQNDEDALNPKPKLKPLHWDKVRASSDREMVWDQLKCSSFKLDEEMIETLFVVKTPKPNPNEANRWQVLPPPGLDNGDKVLDPKKSQNIAILLKALHVTVDEVCEGLLEGNAEILGMELLESLLKMAPSKEEERKLKEHDDDSSIKLGPAERFLKAVVDIPHAFRRVEALLYVSNFESEVEYLKTSFATLEAACEELRTSRMFLKLLEAVLKTGNRMNVGTNRGDAHAFKLDTLLKLVDVKGADGKTTLLHFVVQEIIRSEGARLSGEHHHTVEETSNDARCRKLGLQVVSALTLELSNVKKAAVMDAEVLSTYVSKLSKGITNVNEILKLNEAASVEESSKFAESMNNFIDNAEEEIFKIQAQERLALSLVKEITEYFHGNSAMEEPHPFRIFMVVRDFLTVLDRVCKEVGMINERTIVSSAHRFPVPVNPMLQQATGVFHRRQQTSSDDESLLPFNV